MRRWQRMRPDLAIADEHLEHLRDQLGFIDASCERFDAGVHAEAKRLAIAVRVLAYDTTISTGLLTRMGMKQILPWADGTIPERAKGRQAREGAWRRPGWLAPHGHPE